MFNGPCAHNAAVDRIEVVSVGALPKIGCRSSSGIRKRPTVALPQLPCRPTNVSRPPRFPPLVSPLIDDSIWKMALSPPPRLSVPRTPRREELLLRRLTVGFELLSVVGVGLQAAGVPGTPATGWVACGHVLPLTNSKSTLRRPYSVTFAVCACAASGSANAPATASATSFLFMKFLLCRKKVARKLALRLPSEPSQKGGRSWYSFCQSADSDG